MKKVNESLDIVTMKDIEIHKTLTHDELEKDLTNVRSFNVIANRKSFYGNPFQYHFQMMNLLNCKRDSGQTLYEYYADPIKWSKLIGSTRNRNRGGRTAAGNVYECHRINTGSIVMFKATTAKYLYAKYKATKVLDPCAGWGGRMIGAWALDIDYTGIDTNTELMPAYNGMMETMNDYGLTSGSKLSMIWESCLDVDFSEIEYDMILTSPPYINMELYEHMEAWDNDQAFYEGFFLPLFNKCKKHIKTGGTIAFNISPKMYEDALTYGLPVCDEDENLLQQMGSTTKKQDKIYIWKC